MKNLECRIKKLITHHSSLITQKGFTLIEVILVVAIILIIGTMSSAFYARFILQNGAINTQDQLVQSLRKAQLYAMLSRKSNTSGWGVSYGSNTITVYQGPNYTGRTTSLDETFSVNPSVTVSGLTDINFARISGTPTPSTLTITITNNNTNRTITVNQMGMVTK